MNPARLRHAATTRPAALSDPAAGRGRDENHGEPGGTLRFAVPPALEASTPPEARGLSRDGVRLLVGRRDDAHDADGTTVGHHRFVDLPGLLRPGDLLVVNTSATLPAAVTTGRAGLVAHFSTPTPDGAWLVELRRSEGKATVSYPDAHAGEEYPLPGGARLHLTGGYAPPRLWRAEVDTAGEPDLPTYLHRHGRPIRYGYVHRDWPLSSYQTIFSAWPPAPAPEDAGSAEMPSAGRPFTPEVVARLVAAGVIVATVTLHTGVASPEAAERPYPERFAVPDHTARIVDATRAGGGRVIAVGTTVVRALESAAVPDGRVWPTSGWTDLVVTPERGVRAVDGLLTGFHEPAASHLLMIEAIAGRPLVARCYEQALASGYLWHEFGDLNLLLP